MNKRIYLKVLLFLFPLLYSFSQSVTNFTPSNSSSEPVSIGTIGTSFSDVMDSPTNIAQKAMSTDGYPVTPSDIYTLTFITASGQQNLSLYVEMDYSIQVGTLGKVSGKGKTFQEIALEIKKRVDKAYPLSSPQVFIASVGVFPVKIVGEVNKCEEVYVWSLTRLSSLLSERLTDYSSIRNITIKNEQGTEREYDLFKATRYGVIEEDPYVTKGDTIIVKELDRKVVLEGEIRRPGSYQLLQGENLESLIQQYGMGFTEKADKTRIEIYRFLGDKETVPAEKISINYKNGDVPLQNRDRVVIKSSLDLLPLFIITGAIQTGDGTDVVGSNRVLYQFKIGETLGQVVRSKKNNFSQSADLKNAYMDRKGEKIMVDLTKFLFNADFTDDVVLEDGDVLTVPFKQFFVTVSGAVRNPGRYPYIPDRTWRYYVSLAGGIDEERNSNEKVTITDMNDNPIPMDAIITPEAKIKVPSNSFLYYFNKFAPVVTTVLSIVSTTISLLILVGI